MQVFDGPSVIRAIADAHVRPRKTKITRVESTHVFAIPGNAAPAPRRRRGWGKGPFGSLQPVTLAIVLILAWLLALLGGAWSFRSGR